jgi:malonyl CoA-acyl carrier protein transacylase
MTINNSDIAIIGLSGRFPGADNTDAFWQNLLLGIESISFFSDEELELVERSVLSHPNYVKAGGVLPNIDKFDASFFGYSTKEAELIDPQQRILLECAWEALENAGYDPGNYKGLVGVYAGSSTNSYLINNIYTNQRFSSSSTFLKPTLALQVELANEKDYLSTRISYKLNLTGPSVNIQTACSTSLVAVHTACQSLLNGECDMAIAGGVSISVPQKTGYFYQENMILSPDGHCRAFDAQARGTLSGSGVGIVVLKLLSEAITDGDNIIAVIKGSAINNDGSLKLGFTAPSIEGQAAVISDALAIAEIDASTVTYVETHGTGTALGDPIEITALTQAFRKTTNKKGFCAIGSVKTNLGHLDAAAGIAGLIKTVLALKHKCIPPSLHFKQPNPQIDFANSPFYVNTALSEWQTNGTPRRAGVSSFGMGGTNCHVVLEEAPQIDSATNTLERDWHILCLSAKTEKALQELQERYVAYLKSHLDAKLADICFTANIGRKPFNHRSAVVAQSVKQLLEQLEAGATVSREVSSPEAILACGCDSNAFAFLFTGQGSQYVNMGRQLYEQAPTFRETLNRCDEILRPYLEQPLLWVLYPDLNAVGENYQSKINETAYTQPALFALEYALFELWKSWGIEPDVVMGHSVGEYVAACVAGVFSLEDGLKLIAARGKLMQALPSDGEMVALLTDEARATAAIEPYAQFVSIAAINGPESVVISGRREAINAVCATLEASGIKTKKLKVSHSFHSPLMEPMLGEFERVARLVNFSSPQIKLLSNVTGTLATDEIATPEYWCRHITNPVRFAASMECLQQQGVEVFIEIGPKPILLGMARQCLPFHQGLWLPSLRPEQDNWQQILQSLAALYVRGVNIDWSGFERDYQRNRVVLPTYPFQRQRYWIEQQNLVTQQQITATSIEDWFYQGKWELQESKPKSQSPITARQSPSTWLIFADQGELGKSLVLELEKEGQNCLLVYSEKNYKFLNPSTWSINPTNPEDFQRFFQEISSTVTSIQGIIHLWSLDTPASKQLNIPVLEDTQKKNCGSVLHLIQTLFNQSISSRLWIITRGVQAVDCQIDNLAIAQSPLWGLGKVIAVEHPDYWGGMVDLAPNPELDEAVRLLTSITQSEGEDHVAFRNEQTYVARLVKIHNSEVRSQKTLGGQSFVPLNSQNSYLITGGLGGLGLKLAQWLVQQGAKYLILVGRRGASSKANQTIKALEQVGAKILVTQADVSQEEDLLRVLEACKASMPPLGGIIHAAGTIDDGILQSQSWERFRKVMAPKVLGTWNLHNLTQDIPLDFFIMFSSLSSLGCSPGQGNYAAANAFIDAIAHYRQAQGLPALSINWGPWAEVGMATNQDYDFNREGLNLISPEQGLQAFTQLLQSRQAQVGVFSIEWEKFSERYPYAQRSPYFQKMLGKTATLPSQAKLEKNEPIIFKQLLEISSEQRQKFLQSYLQSCIAQILQMQIEQISLTDSLLDLGMDSLMVMEAINQLKSDLQLMLYPKEFYERPRIDALAKYLAVEFERNFVKSQESGDAGAQGTSFVQESGDRNQNNSLFSIQQRLSLQLSFPEKPADSIAHSTSVYSTQHSKLNNDIVFILSSGRSGSTLLRVMLAGHPALYSPPELHLLPFETMAQWHKELAASYLVEGLQRTLMELKGIDAPESRELVNDLVKQNLSIQEVYAMLQKLAGKRLLVDKSPTYADKRKTLERAEELFAKAKYIHLVRHPYAVIESFTRMRMHTLLNSGEENPYQLAESTWANSNQNILDFCENISPERHHLVRYEELVTEPTRVMEGVCEFLGIPFDSSVLQPYQGNRMTDGVYDKSMSIGDPNFLKHNQIESKLAEIWKEIKLPSQLGGFAQRVAQTLQYELPHSTITPALTSEPKMSETVVNVRDLNLCLCSWGLKEAPLVLCVHGILEQGAAWSEVAIRLAQKGYHIVAPDLRGHGRSDHVGKGGSYNLLDFLADIDAIAETLTDESFTLVGHSLGSMIAALFASIRPQKVKNLVLVETGLPTEVNEDESAEQLATHLDYLACASEHPIFPDVTTAADRLRQATPALSQSLAMMLAQRITEPCEGGMRWRWAPLLRTRAGIGFNGIDRTRYLGLLRRIQTPITLVYGDKSNFHRPEDLPEQQVAMPKAERIVLSGGHNLHIESPSALARIIERSGMALS